MTSERGWDVLLLGGASGVGKTSVSYRLAHHYGVGLTEVDDFQVVLEQVTTPEQAPVVHYWRTHREEAMALDDTGWLEHFRAYGRLMATILAPVIANHLETKAPTVLEGDFLLPALAVEPRYASVDAGGRVRAVFLYEDDEDQIRENYRRREGTDQRVRAHVSAVYSQWIRSEALRLGIPVVPARPWATGLERVIEAIDRI